MSKCLVMQVEICARCNLRCEMCYYPQMKRKKGFMSFETFKKVVQGAKALGLKRIRLFVFGEPLLHPDLIEFLRYMALEKMEADITTNGLYMTYEHMQEFVSNKYVNRVVFSLEGLTQKVYESIRIGSDYNTVTANLTALHLLARTKRSHLQVEINTLVMDKTVKDHEAFVEHWQKKQGIKVTSHYVLTQAGTVPDLGKEARGSGKAKKQGRCIAPQNKLVIYWDGKVGYCCSDGEAVTAFANVNEEDLKSIWAGPTMQEERRKFFAGESEFCKKCLAYKS